MTEDHEAEILRSASLEDQNPLWRLLEEHRPRLRRMVELRMHPRVRGRIDASDVIQESFLEVFQRLDGYREQEGQSFFLWLRFLTAQKLIQFHRRHLGAAFRDAKKEVPMAQVTAPAASSAMLASAFIDSGPSPSEGLIQEENLERLESALEELRDIDREILALRHFEQLTNLEVAQLLGLKEATASQRYLRAVDRLRAILETPGERG